MAEEMSKSAKRRAAKKARDAEEPAAAAPPAPPAPPAGGYPAAEPKAKAKAKPSPKAAAAPEPAKAEPKAKAKAKAEPKAEPKAAAKAKAKAEPAPPPPAPEQPAAKSKKKKGGENKDPNPQPKQEEPMKKQNSPGIPAVVMDDGTGGDWDVCTGLTKKQQKYKERKDEEARAKKEIPQAVGGKYVPGLTAAPAQTIPGMAKGASQSLVAAPLPMPPKFEGAEAPKVDPSATSVQIKVPDEKIGIVIGPKGANIKMIQEKTGVTRIDTSGEVFTIMGPADAVGMAEQAINDLITKGYTALTFDDFSENYVMVMSNNFPDLIGKQGVVIRAIKEQLKVEVSIPKTGPPGKKWKVSVAGSAKNVEKAKEVINDIVMYHHHEITHPGEDHAELDVPAWAYSFIIGKAGSELRHIQNNYKVKMHIPREGISESDKVIIVGEKHNVERCVVYVQKLLSGAEDMSKGRDRQEKTEDPWGAEEPEEEWMKQYMYKRK